MMKTVLISIGAKITTLARFTYYSSLKYETTWHCTHSDQREWSESYHPVKERKLLNSVQWTRLRAIWIVCTMAEITSVLHRRYHKATLN